MVNKKKCFFKTAKSKKQTCTIERVKHSMTQIYCFLEYWEAADVLKATEIQFNCSKHFNNVGRIWYI